MAAAVLLGDFAERFVTGPMRRTRRQVGRSALVQVARQTSALTQKASWRSSRRPGAPGPPRDPEYLPPTGKRVGADQVLREASVHALVRVSGTCQTRVTLLIRR